MRTRLGTGALLAVLLAGIAPARADEPTTWKLVVLAYGHDEFLIADVSRNDDGSMTGKVVDSQSFLAPCEVKSIEMRGDDVQVTLSTAGGTSVFRGTRGQPDEPILGTFLFRDAVYPARVEKTSDRKVGKLSTGEVPRAVASLRQTRDPAERAEKLRELLKKHEAEAAKYHIQEELVRTEAAAGASAEELRKTVDAWLADARTHGEPWVAESRLKILRIVGAKAPYAALAKELAVQADRATGEDAPLKQRAEVARLLASAAELAGDAELARAASERSAALETRLDEEYLATVPPFQPEPFAGRTESGADRVVLMELFTGAQCPPCVAADVAFDALFSSYKPTELIGLQYHLHIPGPDPLTNPDTLARAGYYTANSTPTVLLDGEPLPQANRGGGPMAAAEMKYGQYRKLIDERLAGKKRATIELKARREGDSIRITAEAATDPNANPDKGAEPRLRLVLTEESIRYVGSNGLRFHHHVVRDMPGGPDGVALTDGKASQELTVDLNEVRDKIETYLSDFEKTRSFPFALPKIDLANLSIVAFVQDDADKRIWHAVSVPVGEAK
jgi:hypothetical protein